VAVGERAPHLGTVACGQASRERSFYAKPIDLLDCDTKPVLRAFALLAELLASLLREEVQG
jgi:hypothetical protein